MPLHHCTNVYGIVVPFSIVEKECFSGSIPNEFTEDLDLNNPEDMKQAHELWVSHTLSENNNQLKLDIANVVNTFTAFVPYHDIQASYSDKIAVLGVSLAEFYTCGTSTKVNKLATQAPIDPSIMVPLLGLSDDSPKVYLMPDSCRCCC